MSRYICIHGHFYQPPRENPWLEEIELQDSAAPYHDWNQRISAECYAPNASARILDEEKYIVDICNNYSRMSFNFGPSLLSWMQRNDEETYEGILEADRLSMEKFSGHGSAMAQCYNHMIMPLANSRDKRTQIVWGIKDFEYRFNRKPEGMWLPETAVDLETLELLVQNGISFTVLSPNQAKSIRRIGCHEWQDVSGSRINIKCPYRCLLPSGKSIALFFYEGPTSRAIAFQNLLDNGTRLANSLLGLFSDTSHDELVHIATDGETYGHHHHLGDMALAFCLNFIERMNFAQLTNYGEYLATHPPEYEVEIFENSSWSCIHGIERWRNNCGCCSGQHPGWTQGWRKPLREGMDWLREILVEIYEKNAATYLKNPWLARDQYIEIILDRSPENINRFFNQFALRPLTQQDKQYLLNLLEMQRCAMLMYTSCGWFFDEISGIETVQILQYAARAMQLAQQISGMPLEKPFVHFLTLAPSNIKELRDGNETYIQKVKPQVLDMVRVGAHYAVSSIFKKYSEATRIYCYRALSQVQESIQDGNHTLILGNVQISSDITWDATQISYAVLHLGDYHLTGGVREYVDERAYGRMMQDIKEIFKKGDKLGTIRCIEKHFSTGHYSLMHLFKDEQIKVLYQLLDHTLEEVHTSLRQINEFHYPIVQIIKQLHMPIPKSLSHTILAMLNADLMQALGEDPLNFDKLKSLVEEITEGDLEIDRPAISYIAQKRIESMMSLLIQNPKNLNLLRDILKFLEIIAALSLEINLWKAQNLYHNISKQFIPELDDILKNHHRFAQEWIAHFFPIGEYFKVKIPQSVLSS